MRWLILALAIVFVAPAQAQLDRGFEDEFESSSTQATAPLPAPKVKAKKSWRRFFPNDSQSWKLQIIASAIVNDASTYNRLTTQRIKSGKGSQEFNLAGSMIGGAYQVATLIPWHKHKHKKK